MASQVGGTNSLRGGRKKFGPRTMCGNWVELNKEPGQSLPSGFPHAMYKTDAQQQMLEGLCLRPKRYGAGLPPPEDPDIDYGHVLNYDKRQGDSKWATITSTEFVPHDGRAKSKEFASSFKLIGGFADPSGLKKYRETWTVEADAMRPVRFKTNALISTNSGIPPKFQLVQTRTVPGAPKAVERLRGKILERSVGKPGTGLADLRRALMSVAAERPFGESQKNSLECSSGTVVGDRVMGAKDLTEGLRRVGVTLNDADTQKVAQFFGDRGDGCVCVSTLLRGLRGRMSESRRRAVDDVFQKIDRTGSGVLVPEDVKHRLDTCWQETNNATGEAFELQCRETLLRNLDLYQEGGAITRTGFEDFVGEAFCVVKADDDFVHAAKSLLAAWS